jgi:glycosyltransferase domain-containing protein
MERPEFLARSFLYYSRAGFDGVICVGDSSGSENRRKNADVAARFSKSLNIKLTHYPNPPYLHDGMVVKELLDTVTTKYAVFSGDDDFIIPSSLARCADFLDRHSDYGGAQGARVEIFVENDSLYGKIEGSRYIYPPAIDDGCPLTRWKNYIKSGISIQYSLQRTENLRKAYSSVPAVPCRYLGPELLPCGILAVEGKIKNMDSLHVIFHRKHGKINQQNNIYDVVASPEWAASAAAAKKAVCDALSGAGFHSMPPERVSTVYDGLFRRFLRLRFWWESDSIFSGKTLKRARPLFKFIRNAVQPRELRAAGGRFTLKSLLSQSSPYHADFLPVHELLKNGPA